VSESSGGTGSGLVNGGQTVHRGVEGTLYLDLAKIIGCKTWAFDWKTNLSVQQAYFSQDRYQKSGNETVNVKGNRTPYAPGYIGNSSVNLRLPMGLGAQWSATFVGDQFTDVLNTEKPSADGRIGKLQAYQLLDLNIYYQIPKTGISFNLAMKNMTDERYISSRRPQGIRVGNPRMLFGGIDIRF